MKIILTGATGYVGEGVIINPRDITKLAGRSAVNA